MTGKASRSRSRYLSLSLSLFRSLSHSLSLSHGILGLRVEDSGNPIPSLKFLSLRATAACNAPTHKPEKLLTPLSEPLNPKHSQSLLLNPSPKRMTHRMPLLRHQASTLQVRNPNLKSKMLQLPYLDHQKARWLLGVFTNLNPPALVVWLRQSKNCSEAWPVE